MGAFVPDLRPLHQQLQENQHAAAVALLKEQQQVRTIVQCHKSEMDKVHSCAHGPIHRQTVASSLQGEISDLQEKVKVMFKNFEIVFAQLTLFVAISPNATLTLDPSQPQAQEKQHAAAVALLKEQQEVRARAQYNQAGRATYCSRSRV